MASRPSIRAHVRRALGLRSSDAPRTPFFGTYRTLLQVFGSAIVHQQALQEGRKVARRRGVSAKSAYARAKGTIPHPPRRKRATGPGSYSAADLLTHQYLELRAADKRLGFA